MARWRFRWPPSRYVFVFWAHLGLALVYAMRVNLSVAAEKMQDQFGWSDATKGFVLSAFFIGYLIGQVPGGWIATTFGGKWVFGIGVLATAILTLLLPLSSCGTFLCQLPSNSTNTSSSTSAATAVDAPQQQAYLPALITVRILMGIFESVTYPALYELFSKWAPPAERSRIVAWTNAGGQVGTAIAFPVSGWLVSMTVHTEGAPMLRFFERWPGAFYVFGLAGLVWFVGWSVCVFSSPARHPRIAAEEKAYLEEAMATSYATSPGQTKAPSGLYVALFTSRASLAIFINHFCNNWSLYLMLTAMPSYLNEELGFNLEKAGFLSVLPYLGFVGLATLAAAVADRLTPVIGRRHVRVLMELLANLIPAACFVALGFMTDVPIAVVLTTLSVAVSGLASSGYNANVLDICPRYGGILFSVSNTIATVPGILAPIVTGEIVAKPPLLSQWRTVFFIAAAIYAFGDIVWIAWCRGEPVPALNPAPDESDRAYLVHPLETRTRQEARPVAPQEPK